MNFTKFIITINPDEPIQRLKNKTKKNKQTKANTKQILYTIQMMEATNLF